MRKVCFGLFSKMKNLRLNEAVASSRFLRISPFKVRRVLDQVRGRRYIDSLVILKFMPYKSCPFILKVLNSAVSNLKVKLNSDCNESLIVISEARVDSGPFFKRICPHAQGRGFPIKKRVSHIISTI